MGASSSCRGVTSELEVHTEAKGNAAAWPAKIKKVNGRMVVVEVVHENQMGEELL